MKIIFISLLLLGTLFAEEFYAVLQPIDKFDIKATVSGNVLKVHKTIEGKTVKNDYIIKIDDKIDQVDLEQTKQKLQNLEAILKLEQGTLKSFNQVSSKSKIDKDNQKIKILNIQSTINDLHTKIATLEDRISKKILREKNKYIYNIAVSKGDWVNAGSLLYTTYDLSKGKLEIFLPIKTADSYKNKTIYINDKKTNLKIDKIYKVADTKHISSYKCEIIVPKVKKFSDIVKITFK